MTIEVRRLGASDVALMHDALDIFADAFEDPDTYTHRRADDAWLASRLADDTFIALLAYDDGKPAGALAAYVLHKFEQARSEIYIYDLAVLGNHRRRGLATALIEEVRRIAGLVGAWVVYVQADTGEEDRPAIELYSSLGVRESVFHFDITPREPDQDGIPPKSA